MRHLHPYIISICAILAVISPLQCLSQQLIPDLNPKLIYCITTKDGQESCARGRNFEVKPDGTIFNRRTKSALQTSDINLIESYRTRALRGLGIGTALGVTLGATLLIAGTLASGGTEGPDSIPALFAGSLVGGMALMALGPIVGTIIGNMSKTDYTKVYPTTMTTTSGNMAPAIGFSGRF